MVDAGVVGQHEAAHLVGSLHERTLLAQGYLNRSRAPVDEIRKLLLPHSLQRLVDLGGVHFALDYVQDRHVFPLLGWRTHHDVVRMQ